MRKRWHSWLLFDLMIVIMLIVCAIPGTRAWSNGGYSSDPASPDYGTHDWIAEMALTLQTREVTFLATTYHSKYLLGTEAPDNTAYIGDSTAHHVYFHASGNLQDDASAVRSSQMYQVALGYLTVGDYENAAYYIGAMTHYISDVGVFGHTMGNGTDWGSETHHADYERVVLSMNDSLVPPTGMPLLDKDAYNATIDLAKNITFGIGAIKSNEWMDTNYDWTDSGFVASAMASLYGSVASVASVINHLLIEADLSIPEFDSQGELLFVMVAMIAVMSVLRYALRNNHSKE